MFGTVHIKRDMRGGIWTTKDTKRTKNAKLHDARCVTAQMFVTFADVRDIRGPSFPVGTNPFDTAHLP